MPPLSAFTQEEDTEPSTPPKTRSIGCKIRLDNSEYPATITAPNLLDNLKNSDDINHFIKVSIDNTTEKVNDNPLWLRIIESIFNLPKREDGISQKTNSPQIDSETKPLQDIFENLTPREGDKPETEAFGTTTGLRRAARLVAKSEGLNITEFWRRAAFAVMRDPKLLYSVDDIESEFRQHLGPSRHHR